MALETEIATYERLLFDLMVDEGKYVVILGEAVLGVFEERGEALRVGYERASGDFLCRRILAEQPVHSIPTLFLPTTRLHRRPRPRSGG